MNRFLPLDIAPLTRPANPAEPVLLYVGIGIAVIAAIIVIAVLIKRVHKKGV